MTAASNGPEIQNRDPEPGALARDGAPSSATSRYADVPPSDLGWASVPTPAAVRPGRTGRIAGTSVTLLGRTVTGRYAFAPCRPGSAKERVLFLVPLEAMIALSVHVPASRSRDRRGRWVRGA